MPLQCCYRSCPAAVGLRLKFAVDSVVGSSSALENIIKSKGIQDLNSIQTEINYSARIKIPFQTTSFICTIEDVVVHCDQGVVSNTGDRQVLANVLVLNKVLHIHLKLSALRLKNQGYFIDDEVEEAVQLGLDLRFNVPGHFNQALNVPFGLLKLFLHPRHLARRLAGG